MTDSRIQDEHLETLYHLRERHEMDLGSLKEHQPTDWPGAVAGLESAGLIRLEGDRIELTESGFRRAERIIRRHRLAERLLADVLGLTAEEMERAACEFEHMVAEEVTDGICTLLGHPRSCPHGSPIPEGACCQAASRQCESAVVRLTDVETGVWVRVAYISSVGDERQHRLVSFGLGPGARIKVHQLLPSVVVEGDGFRLAMEQSVARTIFVWAQGEHPAAPAPPPRRDRAGLRRFWQRRPADPGPGD